MVLPESMAAWTAAASWWLPYPNPIAFHVGPVGEIVVAPLRRLRNRNISACGGVGNAETAAAEEYSATALPLTTTLLLRAPIEPQPALFTLRRYTCPAD